MPKINGSIGYTLLIKDSIKVLILADLHSELPYCDTSGIFISEWLKSKKASTVLLEEVPRIKNIELKELWPSSPHTQKLKEIYIDNSIIIQGVDVRPFLLPFSWEIVELKTDCNLKTYIDIIYKFYKLEDPFFKEYLGNIYTKDYLRKSTLGMHYLVNKHTFNLYYLLCRPHLNTLISILSKTNRNILDRINDIISDIMEWYIVAKIFEGIRNNKKSFIIHAGLAHTAKLIDILQRYDYKITRSEGATAMTDLEAPEADRIDSSMNGCLLLPEDINNQFGGFLYN